MDKRSTAELVAEAYRFMGAQMQLFHAGAVDVKMHGEMSSLLFWEVPSPEPPEVESEEGLYHPIPNPSALSEPGRPMDCTRSFAEYDCTKMECLGFVTRSLARRRGPRYAMRRHMID